MGVAGGQDHTCALLAGGTIGCWGSNEHAQLAREGLAGSVYPVAVEGVPEPMRLVAGHIFTCAVTEGSAPWCWGDGSDVLLSMSVEPRPVPELDVFGIAFGGTHSCAIVPGGEVWCWGIRNGDGQLGIGTRDIHREPVLVEGVGEVIELDAGYFHVCARTADNELWCWGRNREGQIGDGTGGSREPSADALAPVLVLEGVRRIAAGANRSCALRGEREALCWGRNVGGSLGTGSLARALPSPEAVRLPGGVAIADIAGAGSHTCALARSGRVLCWGGNGHGQLGFGSTDGVRLPVEVGGVDDATDIALGYHHSCAVRSGGELWCWGSNEHGQLGDGTTEDRSLPVKVVGLR